MKKLIFAIAAVVLMAGSVMAQTFGEQSISVRAGLNISKMKTDGMTLDGKAGFHVGGVYQHLLTKKAPLYIETGLYVSQKGFKVDSDYKANAFYFEVPVLLNYKFLAGDEFIIYPSAGFYYGLGFAGKMKVAEAKTDTFGDGKMLERSDLGVRASCTLEWRSYLASVGYDYSLFDAGKDGKAKNRTFFISVGYKF